MAQRRRSTKMRFKQNPASNWRWKTLRKLRKLSRFSKIFSLRDERQEGKLLAHMLSIKKRRKMWREKVNKLWSHVAFYVSNISTNRMIGRNPEWTRKEWSSTRSYQSPQMVIIESLFDINAFNDWHVVQSSRNTSHESLPASLKPGDIEEKKLSNYYFH